MSPRTGLARLQLRRRRRDLVPIALLVAAVGTLALGGAAGARRTQTAFDRMAADTEAWDVLVNPHRGTHSSLEVDDLAGLEGVEAVSRFDSVLAISPAARTLEDAYRAPTVLATDGVGLYDFGRPIMTSGRMPDPTSAREILVDHNYAASAGLEVGDRLPWRVLAFEDLSRVLDHPDSDALRDVIADTSLGTTLTVEVVGIGVVPDGVVVDGGFEPNQIYATPALWEAAGGASAGYWGAIVRLRDGAGVEAFRRGVEALVPDETVAFQTLEATERKTERAANPTAMALASFAATAAGIGMLLVAQNVSRRVRSGSRDSDLLAALGATRLDRFAADLWWVTVATGAGMVVAVVGAWLVSPLAPAGAARLAEPDPGRAFHAPILLGGAAVLLVLLVAACAVPTWRAAARRVPSEPAPGSVTAQQLARAGAPVALTTGVRFGVEPGYGERAVPTRTTILATTIGIITVVSTLVFAASLDHVVQTPRLYGSSWNEVINVIADGPDAKGADRADRFVAALLEDPAVDRAGAIAVQDVRIGGDRATALGFSNGPRAVEPTLAAGRLPATTDQVALGRSTMDRLQVGIGDHVDLHTPGHDRRVEVVGRVVLPGVGTYSGADRTALGEGLVVHPEVIQTPPEETAVILAAQLHEDADRGAFRARTAEELSGFGELDHQAVTQPGDIQSLERLRAVPVVLAWVLVALVALTAAHALAVAVRARRRDVAVLSVLGATRNTVRGIGLWQAVTIAGIATSLGVPLGVIVGRVMWQVMAERFGTLVEPVVPTGQLVVVVGAAMAISCLIGLVPIQRALRVRPAAVLRAE